MTKRTWTILVTLAFLGATVAMLRPGPDPGPLPAGAPASPERAGPAALPAAQGSPPPAVELPCPTAGYLCAGVDGPDPFTVRRWSSHSGTLVVHVPLPTSESLAEAQRLQSAAAAGIRAWNGHPFPVRVELRSAEGAHFSVRWSPSLGGEIIGAARTRWSAKEGLTATSIDLVTRDPFDTSRLIRPDQVRLTAAHEMGHALGLPHSDAPRDVMYSRNTASSLSARDYRSMESLYALPDGARLLSGG